MKESIIKARRNSTNLYFPDGLLEKVNAITKDKSVSRNGWIIKAIMKELNKSR